MKISNYFLVIFFLLLNIANAHIKIALTFDDGPAIGTAKKESPTKKILDVLKDENISAAFFILTGPDKWLGKVLKRGETAQGLKLIRRTIRDNHLIACHWGGTYIAQKKLHPNRLKYDAYDYNGDGVIDKVTKIGNALETDLMQCMDRLEYALSLENLEEESIEFIRPPLWVYKNKSGDARFTYKALGLKMILTDAKLYDGGFGLQRLKTMLKDMKKAIILGQKDIILTMHDPMRRTAKNLKKTILKIRKKMKKMNLVEGMDWSFTKNKRKIKDLFKRKTYFVLNKLKL